MSQESNPKVRLSKIISERGICSRREADELLKQGLILADGKVAQLGERFDPKVIIELQPKASEILRNKFTVILNKPMGYLSHQAEGGKKYPLAVSLITLDRHKGPLQSSIFKKITHNLAPAGRLDVDSKGLLILTQNGAIAKKIIDENSQIEKEYLVRFQGSINEEILESLRSGEMVIDNKQLKKAKVEPVDHQTLSFTLTEGRHRQIRKMCEAFDIKVTNLQRVRIGKILLAPLEEGQWRILKSSEDF